LRALHGRGTPRVPDTGREASRPYNETIVLLTFYEIINFAPRDFSLYRGKKKHYNFTVRI